MPNSNSERTGPPGMTGGVSTDLESSFEAHSAVTLADPDNSMPMDVQASEEEELSDSDIAYEEDELSEKVETAKLKYAVHTGLYEALPVDVRLEVYKAAFPEMKRSRVKSRPGPGGVDIMKVIDIQYITGCRGNTSSAYVAGHMNSTGFCTCSTCKRRQEDRLRRAWTSNFARDPAIRAEFLGHYLSLVQFRWAQWKDEYHPFFFEALPEFFELIHTAGLIPYFKHLSVHFIWSMKSTKKGVWNDDNFRSDALFLARIFGILHAYKIKALVVLDEALPCRTAFLDRIVELCKTRIKRRMYKDGTPSCAWCSLTPVATDIKQIFFEDEPLRKCANDCKPIHSNLPLAEQLY